MILIGFPSYRSRGVSRRDRTIKRGSQVCNSIISFEEISNLCILSIILSWLLFGSYPCEALELVVIFMTSYSLLKTDFSFVSYRVFDLGGFPVFHQGRYLTL